MRNLFFAFAMALLPLITQAQKDSILINHIYNEALSNGKCHEHLRSLCKDIGPRLSGSQAADDAILWGKEIMEGLGADTVYLQDVQVPHWVRGDEEKASCEINGLTKAIHICALGGSIGTSGNLSAEVIQVKRLEDLEKLGREKIEGKIVLFNRALDPVLINTGAAYGGAYDQRSSGASEASKYGAVGVLIRSLTHALDTKPHTGSMRYIDGVNPIPAAAISTVDANALGQAFKDNSVVKVTINLNCQLLPKKMQANVIAEITGSQFPNEYIVVGGHLDSWDIGEGAHDDGAGIVHSIEVLHLFKALNIRPKHTIRVVLYINEENGNNGGKTYARIAKEKGEKHVAALESDMGGFVPRGFSMEAKDDQVEIIRSWEPLFSAYNIHLFRRGWSGVDIRPLKNGETALVGLVPDNQRYFDFHHSANDVFENVHKRELELGSATVASLIYLLDQHF